LACSTWVIAHADIGLELHQALFYSSPLEPQDAGGVQVRRSRLAFSPSALLHGLYHRLGRSPIAVRTASTVRNQLDAVIRYHFADAIKRRAIRWVQFEYNAHWRIRGATLPAAAQLFKGYELYVILRTDSIPQISSDMANISLIPIILPLESIRSMY
jgi:hypothetical protein